ncbi:MAG TPA: ABC transporter permease [Streptosporangiaceae bacterium]|nr:ABC transporter permease [Streptosporangiaceae bacterium]
MTLHAEWTKLRTSPGTAWLLLAIVALTATLGALADAATRCPSAGCGLDPARVGLTGVYLSQAVVVILGALAIGAEYNSGMIKVTLSAMPRRLNVLAAKAVIITGLVLASATLAVLGSLSAGLLILPGRGFTTAHGFTMVDGPVLRAYAGTVLYLALIGLLSLGAAAALRDTAAAIGIVLGLLYVLPIVATVVSSATWHRHLEQLAPMTAGLAIQDTVGLRDLPITPWAGLGVLAAWAAAALLAGALVLRLRDA